MKIDGPDALQVALRGEHLHTFQFVMDVRFQRVRSRRGAPVGEVELRLAQDRRHHANPLELRLRLHETTVFSIEAEYQIAGLVIEYIGDRGWEDTRWKVFNGEQGSKLHCYASGIEVELAPRSDADSV